MVFHFVGIGKYLVLKGLSANNHYLGHPAHRKQPLPDLLIGYGSQPEHIDGVGTEGDQHDLSHDGGLRGKYGGRDMRGQPAGYGGQLFAYDLARPENVHIPVEFDPDDGKTIGRGRADPPDAGGPVQ